MIKTKNITNMKITPVIKQKIIINTMNKIDIEDKDCFIYYFIDNDITDNEFKYLNCYHNFEYECLNQDLKKILIKMYPAWYNYMDNIKFLREFKYLVDNNPTFGCTDLSILALYVDVDNYNAHVAKIRLKKQCDKYNL